MANIGNKQASVTITLNGVQEVINGLENMKGRSKALREEMAGLKKQMDISAASGNGELYSQQSARLSELTQEQKKLQAAIREGNKAVQDMNTLMTDLDKKTLKQLQQDLKTAQQKFRVIHPDDLKNLSKGKEVISAIQQAISQRQAGAGLTQTMKELQGVLGNLKTAPLERLKDAQQRLTQAIANSKRGTEEYNRAVQALKGVNKQIDAVTRSFSQQDSVITKTMKRLASYVAVYMGFNQILGKIRQVVSGSLSLSDAMADIQKVTKMTAGQVNQLANAIDRIDTRSAQEQLYKLGYQAGMLGLHTQSDILGFVKAADQMNWALKELGDDGAVQLMKVAMLTGELRKNGGDVEKTLLKVGSSINELTANSAASAGPVVDFVSRMGSVGSVCKYSSAELVGIASTLDALNVHAEMGGTAMNKFMSSLAKSENLTAIADKLGITDDAIRQTGGSMEQMIFILQKLREQGDGGMEALSPFFKDLGSDGERLKTVITTLVNNVDMLSEHVRMARDAYEEGTSATLEFEVKNETAAATFERLGNTIRENFVNSGFVRWLQSVGQWLNNVINYGNRHLVLMSAIKTALGALAGYVSLLVGRTIVLAVTKAVTGFSSFLAVVKSLKTAVNTLKTAMIAYSVAEETMLVWKAQGVTITHEEALADAEAAVAKGAHTTASITLTGALKALYATMASNPFGMILVAIGAVIGAFVALKDVLWGETEAEEAQRVAMENATTTMVEESAAINQKYELLKLAIEQEEEYQTELEKTQKAGKNTEQIQRKLNEAHREHEKRLRAVNEAAGPYTGWMLKIQDKIDTVTQSQLQLNAALREQQALLVRNAMLESATTQLKDTMSDVSKDLSGDLKDMADNMGLAEDKIGAFVGMANAKIVQLAQAGKSAKEILSEITYEARKMGADSWDYSVNRFELLGNINKIVASVTQLHDMTKAADKAYTDMMTDINESNKTVVKQNQNRLKKQMLDSYNDWKKATSDAARKQAFALYEQAYNKLVAISKNSGEEIKSSWTTIFDSMRKGSISAMDGVAGSVKMTAATIRSEMDDTNLSVDESVAQLKRINSILGLKESNPQFLKSAREMLGNTALSAKEAREQLTALGQEIRGYQKKTLHVNESGHVLSPGAGSNNRNGSKDKQLKQDIDAWNEYLKAYYNDRIKIEEQQFLEYSDKHNQKEIDEERVQMEERVRVLTEEYNHQTAELRKAMLNIDNKFGEGGLFGDYFNNLIKDKKLKSLDTITKEVGQKGEKIWDDLFRSMTDAEKKETESMVKHLAELYKLITKYDYVQQAEDQFREALIKNELFNDESYTKMKEWAMTRKNITTKELQDEFHLNEMNANALLTLLNDYHDATIEAEKKQRQRQKKIFDAEYTDRKKQLQDQMNGLDENTNSVKQLKDLGLATDTDVNKMEILAIQAKIDMQREYVECLKSTGAEAADEELKLYNLQKDLAEKHAELQKNKMAIYNDYADAVVTFSESMSEAAFGEVEDRKEAAKQLLKTVMKTTNQLIMQELKHLIQKKMLKKQEQTVEQISADTEVAIEQAKNAKVSTLGAQQTLNTLATDKAALPGKIAEGTASGGAKTVGQLGWWGIPLMAVIGAALAAISGVAMSALNKSEDEVEAETGVSAAEAKQFSKKKVAAGMLTYAVGNYPVMGDDGNTYNARRVNRWNTQVYRGAHYGIVGEKQPELIVDGQTTAKMLTLRPDLYEDILALRDGIIHREAAAYASGLYPSSSTSSSTSSSSSPLGGTGEGSLLSALNDLIDTNNQLRAALASGIRADLVEDFSRDGVVNRMNENRKWMQQHGLLRN